MTMLKELLGSVYSARETEWLLSEIEQLWVKYQDMQDDATELSQHDVVLITYGDQVSDGTRPKLQVLHDFASCYFGGAISMIHILPFYPYSSDDGFSVIDYYQVREDLGDWEDLKSLARDFRLMYDGVINHMSVDSEWFQKYLQGDSEYHGYFVDGSQFSSLDNVVRPRTSPLIHDFDGKKVWTTFSRDQVDLNYAHPKLLLQILDVLLHYVAQGGSLLRLDAIGFLWKKDGTTCIHLDETHTIIKVIRKVIEKLNPGVMLISETNVPHDENISYFGQGDEAHMVYNFTLPPLLAYSIINQTASKLQNWARSLSLKYPTTCFFNFLSSHDGVGVRPVQGILDDEEVKTLIYSAERAGGKVNYRSVAGQDKPYEINCNYFSLLKGGEEENALEKMVLAHAILLAFPGLPAIYFHSLIGVENDLKGLESLGYNRAINREKFDYQFLVDQLENTNTVSFQLLSRLKELISMRKSHKAFDPFASAEIPAVQDGLFAIQRSSKEGEIVLCYFNLSDSPKDIFLEREMKSVVSSSSYRAKLTLPAFGFDWLMSEK